MKKLAAPMVLLFVFAATLAAWNGNTASAATRALHNSRGLALTAISQANSGPVMAPFSSKDGAFSVKIPGVPKEESQTVDTAAGPTILHLFTVEANAGKFAYMIEYSDLPNTPADPAKALDGAINGQVQSFKGTIVSDAKVNLNGWPGRIVGIKSDAVVCLSSAYLAQNRLYQVLFVMEAGETLPANATEFLDSFQITFKGSTAK
jgi:hypothetical protein